MKLLKTLQSLLLLLVGASALAACGGTPGSEPNTIQAASSPSPFVNASPQPFVPPPKIVGPPQAAARVLPVFRSILASLKRQTKVVIFLPTFIPGITPTTHIYATREKTNATSYVIELSFIPHCNEASVCHLGNISGETISHRSPALKGNIVVLSKGIRGYFNDARCGASCSDSTLTWQQGNERYMVAIKAGKVEELVKMANSAIANGRV